MPRIKLFGNLRKLAGTKEFRVAGTDLTVVLNHMIEQIPALDGVIMENGQLRPHYMISINGQIATDLAVSLSKDDVVAVFPPIAGG